MTDLSHWPPIIIRSTTPTDWERKFLASLIARTRRCKPFTARQVEVLGRIVDRFKEETMRDDDTPDQVAS